MRRSPRARYGRTCVYTQHDVLWAWAECTRHGEFGEGGGGWCTPSSAQYTTSGRLYLKWWNHWKVGSRSKRGSGRSRTQHRVPSLKVISKDRKEQLYEGVVVVVHEQSGRRKISEQTSTQLLTQGYNENSLSDSFVCRSKSKYSTSLPTLEHRPPVPCISMDDQSEELSSGPEKCFVSVSGNLTYTKQSAVYKIVYQLMNERIKVNIKLAILSAPATHIRQQFLLRHSGRCSLGDPNQVFCPTESAHFLFTHSAWRRRPHFKAPCQPQAKYELCTPISIVVYYTLYPDNKLVITSQRGFLLLELPKQMTFSTGIAWLGEQHNTSDPSVVARSTDIVRTCKAVQMVDRQHRQVKGMTQNTIREKEERQRGRDTHVRLQGRRPAESHTLSTTNNVRICKATPSGRLTVRVSRRYLQVEGMVHNTGQERHQGGRPVECMSLYENNSVIQYIVPELYTHMKQQTFEPLVMHERRHRYTLDREHCTGIGKSKSRSHLILVNIMEAQITMTVLPFYMWYTLPTEKAIRHLQVLAYVKIKSLAALEKDTKPAYLLKEFLLTYAQHEIKSAYKHQPVYLQQDKENLGCLPCLEYFQGSGTITDTSHHRSWCKMQRERAAAAGKKKKKKKKRHLQHQKMNELINCNKMCKGNVCHSSGSECKYCGKTFANSTDAKSLEDSNCPFATVYKTYPCGNCCASTARVHDHHLLGSQRSSIIYATPVRRTPTTFSLPMMLARSTHVDTHDRKTTYTMQIHEVSIQPPMRTAARWFQ
ncbi:hypothetical protein PR048_009242 [Dryococelus australis]|uniref:Uncharacterized protein n=1 Tax=Dryococelus australis TaxID=614101 RepID=A0ABQ9HZC9_9NEOP|nr:hypothetical protein PR048_009242 [Dryococelus australis]